MCALNIEELETPALVVDRVALDRNLERMRSRIRDLGCRLRPHVKTAKSIDVLSRVLPGETVGITVSSLREAEYFFRYGILDATYAVGLAPGKIPRVISLTREGLKLSVLTDSLDTIAMLSSAAQEAAVTVPVFIELDVDGHRAGVSSSSALLPELAQALQAAPGVALEGVLAHAGGSYACDSVEEIRAAAEHERSDAVHAAERLRAAGLDVPAVSVGSTPTATCVEHLSGVTEVRAGVYMFQDLVMAGLGVCQEDDIALSVLVSVIGHKPEKGWIITDGGWMAMSRDRGTASQKVDQGYGVVRGSAGEALEDDLIVAATNQEHGVVARRDGGTLAPDRYPVGTLLRVLPNHACATAAQHSRYYVVEGRGHAVVDTWERINGW